uniref:Uncharacterized protein n=1 Tax=Physcomitrium patens TaxID=3218 RepID=A0A2K1JY09_PHYPA|nr:hypothetical protein PHYPA_013518 [Physcomitrium patens]
MVCFSAQQHAPRLRSKASASGVSRASFRASERGGVSDTFPSSLRSRYDGLVGHFVGRTISSLANNGNKYRIVGVAILHSVTTVKTTSVAFKVARMRRKHIPGLRG